MKMHLDNTTSNLIADYGSDGITISGRVYQQNLVVNATTVIEPWEVVKVETLSIEQLVAVLDLEPEIILLGSGTDHVFPPLQLQAEVSARGSALEVMSTSAACRTFNVLAAEHRRVAAALFQII